MKEFDLKSCPLRLRAEALGFIVKTGKLLVLCGTYRDSGFYGFPGGGVEFAESVAEAAARELREESGWLMPSPSEVIGLNFKRLWGSEKHKRGNRFVGSDTRFAVGLLGRKASKALGKDGSTGRLSDIRFVCADQVLDSLREGDGVSLIRAKALDAGIRRFKSL